MTATTTFQALGFPDELLKALIELGYEEPTTIQEQSIPVLMQGDDLIAQAQTGTGKTAAFALPVLSKLEVSVNAPQALIIAPTRELAIQVAEAFKSYAKYLPNFNVVPIYGGQEYTIQLRALKRGAHVIVGTPGRVMDHMRKGVLKVDTIKMVVLDEGDVMLNMGFAEDIEWILEQMPQQRQTALFSATMPSFIQKIAKQYMTDAKNIQIKPSKSAVETIEQSYISVTQNQKLDVLTRYLEVELLQGVIIFTRTKNGSEELAEKLQARGYAASALNGDMNQKVREKVIDQIKRGSLDIIVATDVAARGIDVDRIGHVINYDIPHDTESYIHRIGRTGRAGRTGKALLFVTPRERRLLADIERAIQKPVTRIDPPTLSEMKEKRSRLLSEKVTGVIEKSTKLGPYLEIVDNILSQSECEAREIAAALIYLADQANPMPQHEVEAVSDKFDRGGDRRSRKPRPNYEGKSSQGRSSYHDRGSDRRSGGDDRPVRRRSDNFEAPGPRRNKAQDGGVPRSDRRDAPDRRPSDFNRDESAGNHRRAPEGDAGFDRRKPRFDRDESFGNRQRAPAGDANSDRRKPRFDRDENFGNRQRAPAGDANLDRRKPRFDKDEGFGNRKRAPAGDAGSDRRKPRFDKDEGFGNRRRAPAGDAGSDRRKPRFDKDEGFGNRRRVPAGDASSDSRKPRFEKDEGFGNRRRGPAGDAGADRGKPRFDKDEGFGNRRRAPAGDSSSDGRRSRPDRDGDFGNRKRAPGGNAVTGRVVKKRFADDAKFPKKKKRDES